MDALKLYKFINESCQDVDWRGAELVVWLYFWHIEEFTKLLGGNFLAEGGYTVNLQENCIALDLIPICEYFGIEPTDILEKYD